MNWKKLLKDKAGLTQGAKFLLTTVGVGALATYTLTGAVDQQDQQERALRTLSSAGVSSPYVGLQHTESGLSSINIKDGRGQVATARDRERMERDSSASGNFGLDAAQNLSEYSIGQAAQFSDSADGLAMGADKGLEAATQFVNNAPAIARGSAQHTGGAGAADGNGESGGDAGLGGTKSGGYGSSSAGSGSPTGQLGNASMARASGSSSSSSFNPSNPSGSSPRNAAPAPKAYEMSGAMPEGSSGLSAGGNRGPRNSGFGRSRDAGVGRSTRSGRGKSEIDDIATKSAAAANNATRSANEGGRAFHASETSSAGLGSDSHADTSSTSSSDFRTTSGSRVHARGARINFDSAKYKADWIKRRDDAMDKLNETFVTNFLIAMGVIIGGAFLLKAMLPLRDKVPWGLVAYVAVAAILVLAVTLLMVPIFKQVHEVLELSKNPPPDVKPNNFGPYVMDVAAGLAIGAMAATTVFPEAATKAIGKVVKFVFKHLPAQLFNSMKNLFSSEMKSRYK